MNVPVSLANNLHTHIQWFCTSKQRVRKNAFNDQLRNLLKVYSLVNSTPERANNQLQSQTC